MCVYSKATLSQWQFAYVINSLWPIRQLIADGCITFWARRAAISLSLPCSQQAHGHVYLVVHDESWMLHVQQIVIWYVWVQTKHAVMETILMYKKLSCRNKTAPHSLWSRRHIERMTTFFCMQVKVEGKDLQGTCCSAGPAVIDSLGSDSYGVRLWHRNALCGHP